MLCTMVLTHSFAQTESERMTFKGVPIDGSISLTSFVKEMQKKGYNRVLRLDSEHAILTNSDTTAIHIYPNEEGLVNQVVALFVERSWEMLSNRYFELKRFLTEKYGEPAECIEEFYTDTQPTDNHSRMILLKEGLCKYSTYYNQPPGWLVWLQIEDFKVTILFLYDEGNTLFLYDEGNTR